MNVKSIFSKTMKFLDDNQPKIMFGAGIILDFVAIGVALSRSEKAAEIHEESKAVKVEIEVRSATDKDFQKAPELLKHYAKTSARYIRLYALPIGIEVGAKALEIGGFAVLNKRYITMGVIAASLAEENKRLKEERDNPQTQEVDENGNPVEKRPDYPNGRSGSIYARIWDENNPNYGDDPDSNSIFLRLVRQDAQRKLDMDGYLTLNWVYERLGYKPTDAGFEVGWIKDSKDPSRDSYIDFNLIEFDRPIIKEDGVQRFDGSEHVVLLDFNVDGPIRKEVVDRKLMAAY